MTIITTAWQTYVSTREKNMYKYLVNVSIFKIKCEVR